MAISPDVTVIGGGIFGLSCAWEAARRGARVRLIEAHRIGAGSSGGHVGALAPHTPENWNEKKAFQLDALLMADRWWADIAAAGGVDPGYRRAGRLQMVADDKALTLARQREASAAQVWGDHAVWQVVPDADHAGWAPASPMGHLVFDSLSARLSPRAAGRALLAALQARGVEILYSQGATEGRVIEAAGAAGLVELNEHFGKTIGAGVKGQSALLGFDARDRPQLYLDSLHIVPHADGTVAVGSTTERDFDDPDSTDGQLDDVVARARAVCPALADAPVIDRWAGVRPRAKSRAPMLGRHPLRPDRFIANGGFKIGFGMAPKVAQVMADLVLDGVDTIPDGFRPEASF